MNNRVTAERRTSYFVTNVALNPSSNVAHHTSHIIDVRTTFPRINNVSFPNPAIIMASSVEDGKLYKIMRPGFEEKKAGNPRLQAAREQAAPLFAKGSSITDAEKKILVSLYDEMYYHDALTKLLDYHHPSTSIARLNKPETIDKLIQANDGLPTVTQ